MTNRLDDTLRFHQTALNARAYRQQVIASNIANADTPNFKARDLDFSAVLAEQSQQREGGMRMQRTHEQHFALEGVEVADPALRFRGAMHASLDQNSVDMQQEQARYAENAVQFQASFTFLNSKFKGLMGALRGE